MARPGARASLLGWLSTMLALCALPASAQDVRPPDAGARIHWGPLSLKPKFALTNLGRDDNVFNQATSDQPQSDFTMTLTPATDVWMRMGRTWLVGNVKEDLVYYQKFRSERSVNSSVKLGWLVPLNRVTFDATGSYLNTRDRPGFEIDARSQRIEKAGGGSIELRALAKTFLDFRGEYRKVDFDKAAVFLGDNLQYELNRTSETATVGVRHQLTPLTSVSLDLSRAQDRFEFSSLRDANSTQVALGVKFEPFALISGAADIGFRDFEPLAPGVPGFQGLTTNLHLTYILRGATRVTLDGGRDVQYSYDVNQPYYVQTGGMLSVQQHLYGQFALTVRGGYQRLDYREREDALTISPNRTDYVHSYGGGASYRVGKDTNVGFYVDEQRRLSPVQFRTYDGLRYGLAVTYDY